MRTVLAAMLVVLVGLACGTTSEEQEPISGNDAGSPADAGARDAGNDETPDAGDQTPDAGGNGSSVIPCEPQSQDYACPGVTVQSPTLLEALRAFDASAKSEFPEAYWQGSILVTFLTRDGRLSEGGMVSSVGYCANNAATGSDGLRYYFTGTGCAVERLCGGGTCVNPTEIPTVDSPQAIAAAFPNDPEGKRYSISYMGFLGNYWTVTHSPEQGQEPDNTTVKVDATTGEIVP